MSPPKSPQTLGQFVEFVSTLSGSDKVLEVLAYGLQFVGHVQIYQGRPDVAKGLIAAGGEVSKSRIVPRFWSTFGAAHAIAHWNKDQPFALLTLAQLVSWFAFAPPEHAYWLRITAPQLIDVDPVLCARLSSSWWLFGIVADLAVKVQLLAAAPSSAKRADVVRTMVPALCNAPLALHWARSPDQPLLDNLTVNFLGTVGSLVALQNAWRAKFPEDTDKKDA